jgi:tripartite-type tricarboxylate transporter receptor subunit TctC
MKEKCLAKQLSFEKDRADRRRLLKLAGMMLVAFLLSFFSLLGIVMAKDIYPAKDISFICYSTPGGSFDIMARGMAPYLTKYLREVSPGAKGGDVKIKNMSGGAMRKAVSYLYNEAKPDGYTIGDFNRGNLYKFCLTKEEKFPFDVLKFTWLFSPNRVDRALISSKRSSIKTWGDMLALSKKERIKWALARREGSSQDIEAYHIMEVLGIPFNLSYWGTQAALTTAIIRGDAQVTFTNVIAVNALIEAKEANCLVTFTEERIFPDVPTIKEVGFPQLLENVGGKGGTTNIGPPNLDPEAKRILIAAAKKMFKDPGYLDFAKNVGAKIDPIFDKEIEELNGKTYNFYTNMLPTLKKYGIEE